MLNNKEKQNVWDNGGKHTNKKDAKVVIVIDYESGDYKCIYLDEYASNPGRYCLIA